MALDLYYLPDCPFCIKVLDYIEENGLDDQITLHDIDASRKDEETLEDLTGDTQVPALVIDGEPMLESEDIIAWLRRNAVESKAS